MQMKIDQLHNIINTESLHKIGKETLYSFLYGAIKPMQEAIDEEGCGSVFAMARLVG